MKKHRLIAMLTALLLALGLAGAGQAEIIPAEGEGQIGLMAVVLCEKLTIRQEPASSARSVKTLRYGDRIIVQPQTGGWALCFLSEIPFVQTRGIIFFKIVDLFHLSAPPSEVFLLYSAWISPFLRESSVPLLFR